MSIAFLVGAGLLVLFLLATVLQSFFFGQQQWVYVIERFGRFARVSKSGIQFKIPWFDVIAGKLSLRVQQLGVTVETITKDKVPVKLVVAVQYSIPEETGSDGAVWKAFYRLTNVKDQMESFVFNAVRARVPSMDLDDLFEKQDDIAESVKATLGKEMGEFGYKIMTALVTEIDPDPKVKAAMADINTAQREQKAAEARGEAIRIMGQKEGEAFGDKRLAILKRWKEGIDLMGAAMPEADRSEVMMMVLISQYLETLQQLGDNGKATTILLPGSPGGVGDFLADIRNAVLVAGQANKTA